MFITFAVAASIPFERRNVPGLNCGTGDALSKLTPSPLIHFSKD
jgi:hypothetical protein